MEVVRRKAKERGAEQEEEVLVPLSDEDSDDDFPDDTDVRARAPSAPYPYIQPPDGAAGKAMFAKLAHAAAVAAGNGMVGAHANVDHASDNLDEALANRSQRVKLFREASDLKLAQELDQDPMDDNPEAVMRRIEKREEEEKKSLELAMRLANADMGAANAEEAVGDFEGPAEAEAARRRKAREEEERLSLQLIRKLAGGDPVDEERERRELQDALYAEKLMEQEKRRVQEAADAELAQRAALQMDDAHKRKLEEQDARMAAKIASMELAAAQDTMGNEVEESERRNAERNREYRQQQQRQPQQEQKFVPGPGARENAVAEAFGVMGGSGIVKSRSESNEPKAAAAQQHIPRDPSKVYTSEELMDVELFDEPPPEAFLAAEEDQEKYDHLHEEMESVLADERALLNAADPNQHHAISQQFFQQKMAIMAMLPPPQQLRYFGGPSVELEKRIEKLRKEREKEKKKAKKERKKREEEQKKQESELAKKIDKTRKAAEKAEKSRQKDLAKAREKENKDRKKRGEPLLPPVDPLLIEAAIAKAGRDAVSYFLGNDVPSEPQSLAGAPELSPAGAPDQPALAQQQQAPVRAMVGAVGQQEELDPDFLFAMKMQEEENQRAAAAAAARAAQQ